MTLSELRDKIRSKEAKVGVIGLGYVGLPVACVFADTGFDVMGLDIKSDTVELVSAGRCPIKGEEPGLADLLAKVVAAGRLQASTTYPDLSTADVVLINVETPVDADHVPDYQALRNACRSLGPVLGDGSLVIVESTVAPGTMEEVVRPHLEHTSGRRVNEGFYVGACPERVMPGKLLANLRTMSRVCGGYTPETAEIMRELYRHIVDADLDLADPVTAALVKTAENAYRDVQIAFANEVALICEAAGADVWRVRELVNKSPYRQMHMPGAGVGGHCIPKDPWLLASAGSDRASPKLIPTARAINDGMPFHVFELLEQALADAGRSLVDAGVLILGYAYLENSDDSRNSPSAALVGHLRAAGMEPLVHDPWVPGFQGDMLEFARGCDAAVLMVAHREYLALDLAALRAVMRTPVLVDGRRLFGPLQAAEAGLSYRAVGLGRTN